MIYCWINDRCQLLNGQIIKILYGFQDHSFGFRVTRLYNYTDDSNFAAWEDNSRRNLEQPIIGMVTNIDHRANNTTFFNLHSVRTGLPPFNTDDRPLTKTFISSRMDELNIERSQVALGIYDAGSEPIYFEGFPPESRPAEHVMIDQLDHCHIYVGIFGSEYSNPTILEYRRAEVLNRPRLCFIKNMTTRNHQLTDFIVELRSNVVYRNFDTPQELRVLVRDAIEHSIPNLFE